MIIPTCHPLTALKHPSIRPHRYILGSKQSSLSLHLSVTYHYSRHAAPLLPFALSAHLSLITMCQLFAREAAKKANSLTLHQDGTSAEDTYPFIVCTLDQLENTLRAFFLNFVHTAGWIRSDTGVKGQAQIDLFLNTFKY